MRLTIGKKLAIGFTAIVATIAAAAGVQLTQAVKLERSQFDLIEERVPIISSIMDALRSLDRTGGSLRGYLLTGNKDLINRRLEGWGDADAAFKILDELKHNIDEACQANLKAAEDKADGMKKLQAEAERYAASDDNIPADQLMRTEINGRIATIVAEISKMKEIEERLEATPQRKRLLGSIADFRDSISYGFASLREFVTTGEAASKEDFNERWTINTAATERIDAAENLLTPEQKEHWATITKLRAEFAPLPAQVISLRESPEWNRARFIESAKLTLINREVRKHLLDIYTSQVELLQKDKEHLAGAMSTTFWATIGGTIATALLAIAIGVFVTRQITRALAPVVDRARAIAKGDLSGPTLVSRSSDETRTLTDAMNEMTTALRSLVGELDRASQEVSAAATEIAASSEQMSGGIRTQNTQLGDMASAVSELNASIGDVAAQARTAATSAGDSGKTAQRGSEIVQATVSDMKVIKDQTASNAQRVQTLGERGKKVGEVAQVIDDIAEQINLLALNAAIEAARAGEHGRGFAVVADEVRKLADRTSTATSEIAESIKAIQEETSHVVDAIQAGRASVDEGMQRATNAGKSLSEILSSVNGVSTVVSSIAAAAQEQASASDQISRSIESVNATARETDAGSTQCATAANQLSGRAESLRVLVQRFKL